jgi:hypothetical protein
VTIEQQAVRQHYVPACYLARFTLQGSRCSPFFVHSIDGPIREDIPDHVGFQRHYHTISVAGFRPDHLEGIFRNIEEPACALFKTLSASPGHSLTESEKDVALLFFSIQAARIPQSRDKYASLMLDCGDRFMKEVAHSPKFFEQVMASAARQGLVIDKVEQGLLRKAIVNGHIKPFVDKNQSAVGIFRLAESILDAIDGMHYTLWYSDGPDWFVCSDYPVGLFYSISAEDPLSPKSVETPTVRLLSDAIYMPLAHNVALVVHRHDNIPTAQRANQQMVAIVNAITVSHARRFICSMTPDFRCVLPNRELGNAKDAIETLKNFDKLERARTCP